MRTSHVEEVILAHRLHTKRFQGCHQPSHANELSSSNCRHRQLYSRGKSTDVSNRSRRDAPRTSVHGKNYWHSWRGSITSADTNQLAQYIRRRKRTMRHDTNTQPENSVQRQQQSTRSKHMLLVALGGILGWMLSATPFVHAEPGALTQLPDPDG